MERHAGLGGLGRSLEDVLGSITPIEPDTAAPGHALFGLVPDDASVTNGAHPQDTTTTTTTTKKKKKKKSEKKSGKGKKQKTGKSGTGKKKNSGK